MCIDEGGSGGEKQLTLRRGEGHAGACLVQVAETGESTNDGAPQER